MIRVSREGVTAAERPSSLWSDRPFRARRNKGAHERVEVLPLTLQCSIAATRRTYNCSTKSDLSHNYLLLQRNMNSALRARAMIWMATAGV
jgi:hypothetical protein